MEQLLAAAVAAGLLDQTWQLLQSGANVNAGVTMTTSGYRGTTPLHVRFISLECIIYALSSTRRTGGIIIYSNFC